MGSQFNQNKPWLDNKGNILNDTDLKKASCSWDQNTWEDYLLYIDCPRSESLLDDSFYGNLCETTQIQYEEDINSRDKIIVQEAINNLTEKQQKIIFYIFWEGLTIREIALRMNISGAAVQKIKNRAVNSLKEQIEGVNTLRIMKGSNSTPFMKQGDAHESECFEVHTSKAS